MVNHNGGDEVLASARSVSDDLTDNDILILVDNGSSDSSVQNIKEKYEQIYVIETGENLPFAAANNKGIKFALDKGYSYIGIINPDVRVRHGMTGSLVKKLEEEGGYKRYGAVSPVMLYEKPANTIWFAGGKIWWLFAWISHIGNGKQVENAKKYSGDTYYLTGCCWLAKSETWKTTGLMDDCYGMYAEDVDWSWRVRRKGLHLGIVPEAILVHRLSQSSGGGRSVFKMKYRTLATRLFFRRFTPFYIIPFQTIGKLPVIAAYFIFLCLKRENKAAKSYLSAHLSRLGERIPWPPAN